MGLLDTTSRWIDIAITNEGRRALSEGDFDVRYFAFNDAGCAYIVEGIEGDEAWLRAPENLLQAEAYSHPRDRAVISTNDFGEVIRDDPFFVSRNDSFLAFSASNSILEDPISVTLEEGDPENPIPLVFSGRFKDGLGEEEINDFIQSWSRDLSVNASIGALEGNSSVHLRSPWGERKLLTTSGDPDIIARSGPNDISTKNFIKGELPYSFWREIKPSALERHQPIQNDEEFASLPQLAFLPPMVESEDGVVPLGSWDRSFPEPVPFTDTKARQLEQRGGLISQLEYKNTAISIQAFLIDRSAGTLKPLSIIRGPSRAADEATGQDLGEDSVVGESAITNEWVAGELRVANTGDSDTASKETHFYRLFRFVLDS